MSSSKDWKAKIHKQHQDEDKSLSSVNERYDNRDTETRNKRYGTHKVKRTKY